MNRCAYLDADHKFTIKVNPKPMPAPDEAVIRIMANGICGSDIHFFREGRLGNFVVTTPYIPGHEASGIVEDIGGNVRGLSRGDRVVIEPGIPCGKCGFCRSGRYNLCKDVIFLSAPPVDGTFCDYIAIRSDCVFKIPANLSFEEAALIEPAAVAVHAVNRAVFHNGDTAAIVGAGPIGLLTLQAFKAAGGGRTICLDRLDNRLEKALECGADETINVASNSNMAEIADVVFETAGSSKATETLFKLACSGGCAVQVGWPDGNVVPMNAADFLEKELVYIGVNRYANAFPTAISWVADGHIDVKKLISHRYSFEQISEAFCFTIKNAEKVIKTVITN